MTLLSEFFNGHSTGQGGYTGVMNQLQTFNFSDQSVRVVIDQNNNPWWYAQDVCNVLGISNGRDAIRSMPEDEKSTVGSTDGGPARNIISEGGLYRLVFQSRKPEAKAFRKWVTSEVLPQIRKTGSYTAIPSDPVEQVLLLANILSKTDKLVLEERSKNLALAHQINEQAPMVEFHNNVTDLVNYMSIEKAPKII